MADSDRQGWRRDVAVMVLATVTGLGAGTISVLYRSHIRHYNVLNLRLQTALDHRDLAEVRFALTAGADPNGEEVSGSGYTALMHAVEHGDPRIVRILLDNGADVNRRDAKKTSAFQQAQAAGRTQIAQILANAGAH